MNQGSEHHILFQGSTAHAILVIHGFTSSSQSVSELAQKLASAGHTVSAPLLAGHGTTEEELAQTPFITWQQQLREVFTSLSAEHEAVWILGQSMGGTLALGMSSEFDAHPKFRGTFLINPAMSFKNPIAHFASILKYAIPKTKAISNDIKRPGQVEQAYRHTPTAAVAELAKLIRAVKNQLIQQPPRSKPIEMFISAEDHVIPASSSRIIKKLVPTSIPITILENSYHVASMDHDSSLIVEKILSKLQEEL